MMTFMPWIVMLIILIGGNILFWSNVAFYAGLVVGVATVLLFFLGFAMEMNSP